MKQESEHSVSEWIQGLKQGDEEAAKQLWIRYSRKMIDIARWKLGYFPRRAFDEEDIAISVFQSLCDGASSGRFPKLTNRVDLWRLLIVMGHRKAADRIRRETCKKRGNGKVRSLDQLKDASNGESLQFLAGAPRPDHVAAVAEEHARLMELLDDCTLKRIAAGTLEGYTSSELASELNVATRTIQRKLIMIRDIWSSEAEQRNS